MDKRNILSEWSSTEGQFPPYVSFNLVDGKVDVVVRSATRAVEGETVTGKTASVSLTAEQFRQLVSDALGKMPGA